MATLSNTLLASTENAHYVAVGHEEVYSDLAGHVGLGATTGEVKVLLDPRARQLVALGVHGPGRGAASNVPFVSITVWDATYVIGMLCGIWVGLWLCPYIAQDFAVLGGWMSVVCLLAVQFAVACRKLSRELCAGGFLHEKLSKAEVSQAANGTVRSAIIVLRTVQLICVGAMILFWTSVIGVYWDEWASLGYWYFVLPILGFLQGFIGGSARAVSLLLALLATTETLRDNAISTARQAKTILHSDLCEPDGNTTTNEVAARKLYTADEVFSNARQLGTDLANARKILQPALVVTLTWSVACSSLFAVTAILKAPSCTTTVCQWPASFWVALSAILAFVTMFATLRGPFRVTDQVNALNRLLEELRNEQRRSRGTHATVGGHNEPEQLIVYRPSRVQWLLSHDEKEMAEVVDEMIAASTQHNQIEAQIQEQQ